MSNARKARNPDRWSGLQVRMENCHLDTIDRPLAQALRPGKVVSHGQLRNR